MIQFLNLQNRIIDSTNEYAIAYKPNIAFFEAHGCTGLINLLNKISKYLKSLLFLKFLQLLMQKEEILEILQKCMLMLS